MRARNILIILVSLSAAIGIACAQPGSYDELIRRLGSENFADRDEAEKELIRLPGARGALMRAVESADKEVARRARVVIEELDRQKRERVSAAVRRYAVNSRIDCVVDAMTCTLNQPEDAKCWEAVLDAVAVLLHKEHKELGKTPGLTKTVPRSIGMTKQKGIATLQANAVLARPRVTAQNLDKGPLGPPVACLIRAEEIDCNCRLAVVSAICSGSLRAEVFGGVIFANGDVCISSILSWSVVVCDGNVDAPLITNSLIIARGRVKAADVHQSTIICGDGAEIKDSLKQSIVLCKGRCLHRL
jgi:hypothetical protein